MELYLRVLVLAFVLARSRAESDDPAADCKAAVKGTPIEVFSGTRIWKIKDKSGQYNYEIGVCNNVGSSDEAVIQRNNRTAGSSGAKSYVVGRLRGTHLIRRDDYIELEYFHGEPYNHHCKGARRTARIIFVCDPCGNRDEGPVVVEEMTTATKDSDSEHCFYLFEWPTPRVCSKDHYHLVFCNRPHLSIGSVLLIMFFVLLGVYITAGCVYKRYAIGAQGMEQCPNVSFWRGLGDLLSDGCDFLCRNGPPEPVKVETRPRRDDYYLDAEESDDDGSLLPM